MKVFIPIVIAAASLSGCGNNSLSSGFNQETTFTIETEAGRAVCVWKASANEGGLSCVWPEIEGHNE